MWAPGLTELDTWSDPALLRPDGGERLRRPDPAQNCWGSGSFSEAGHSLCCLPGHPSASNISLKTIILWRDFLETTSTTSTLSYDNLNQIELYFKQYLMKMYFLSRLITHVCGMAFGDNIGRQFSNNSNFLYLWRVKFDYARPKSLFVV